MKIKIEHAKEEDIDKENSILICMPYGYEGIPGSLTGECEKCGRKIIYAPSAPDLPRKLCVPCGMETIKEIEGEDFEVAITDRQLAEIKEFFQEKSE